MTNRAFRIVSQRAVNAEKSGNYAAAYTYWHDASLLAVKPVNVWHAETRRDFCATCNRYGWGKKYAS
ncbi:ANR family transcriptional regulator [Limnobaculum xujianqingii]|uniref:ANR family transcriptional regulator n=1 Tax=Limnobaculum xujianqingii TaxID=2738837 RepID=UPI0011271777|nr:ANR family transcriptional regulator [Limnobaculum xujianqingii]